MLKVQGLTKKYGERAAVEDVGFEIKCGELVGLLGLNGAGKTTTLNMLTGFLAPTSGKVFINDIDISIEPQKAARHIGFLPDTPPVYNEMTVRDYLGFVYDIKGVMAAYKPSKFYEGHKKFYEAHEQDKFIKFLDKRLPRMYDVHKPYHIADACKQADIFDVFGRIIGHLSRGYKQRVGLAAALIGDPDILILDEPTVGLDPKQIKDFRKLIAELAKSRAVILSTHILPEVEAICERVLILDRGRLIADKKLTGEEKQTLEELFMSQILYEGKKV